MRNCNMKCVVGSLRAGVTPAADDRCRFAWAGPPFQTDDPEPVDFRHYEFYVFGARTELRSNPIRWDRAFEANGEPH